MNIQIPEPQKEVYERAGAKILKLSDPAMSPIIIAVIEDPKVTICEMAKIISMFTVQKQHA